MKISLGHLRSMARDVDDLHRDGMRNFRAEAGEIHLAAARDAGRPGALTDIDIAVFAQSVELAAVAAYGAAAPVLSAGVKPVAALFAQHHQQHADAFGALAGSMATGKANAALVKALTPALKAVATEADALHLAFRLENQAAETYAYALTALQSVGAAKGTASILPIETAHAAVLAMALGLELAAAYPTGAFVAAVVGDGSDIGKGLDPTSFPVH